MALSERKKAKLNRMRKIHDALQLAAIMEDVRYTIPDKSNQVDRYLVYIIRDLRKHGTLTRSWIMKQHRLKKEKYEEVRTEFLKVYPHAVVLVKNRMGRLTEQWRLPENTAPPITELTKRQPHPPTKDNYLKGKPLPKRKRLPNSNLD